MADVAEYMRPSDLGSALGWLAANRGLILAGGTDIYPARPARGLAGAVLDLTALAELCGIQTTRAGIRIGACTRWAAIAAAPMPPALAALQQAAVEVGGRQIQNAGTLGGNLCNASPAADGVPPLLAVQARVELASDHGIRVMDLADFITGPRQTALRTAEVMTAVHIPHSALTGQSRFMKLGARKYLVISIASVAVRLLEREGRVADAAVAVGACSAVPRRLPQLEAALIGVPWGAAAGQIDAGTVAQALAPLDDIRASATYRGAAAAELLRRAVADITGGAT